MEDKRIVIQEKALAEGKRRITGSTLKIIAVLTMLIDHIGAVVLERFDMVGTPLYALYFVMRVVGRLAFPIFCFLLIEGFIHTRNRARYALRLFIFALVSELPFDLATGGVLFNFGYQNVFFTLLIGFLTICMLDRAGKITLSSQKTTRLLKCILTVLIMVAGVVAAYFLKSDYSYGGVVAIVVMYSLRQRKQLAMFGGCLLLTAYNFLEVFAFVDVFLVKRYNGERGLKLKYIFYAFYPVHLLILYFVAVLLGVA